MNIDFSKYADGLVPTIVQDAQTARVLMLGYMNAEAIAATQDTGKVTFFSRSKQRLWTKGETSGNYLDFVSINADCDSDALLVLATPNGPACHTGTATCFGENGPIEKNILDEIENVVAERRTTPSAGSYVSGLFEQGLNRIVQKVGEEAVELVIAAKDDDIESIKNEGADLLFHFLMLLQARGLRLSDVLSVLKERRR